MAPSAGPAFPQSSTSQVVIVARIVGTRMSAERCLRALQGASSGIAVEVVAVDDGAEAGVLVSLTEWLGQERVRVVRDGNARAAIAEAAGISQAPFIWLVDDSTEVAPGCLAALLAVMRTRDTCGAVGAKLLSPDGQLRQAGGVVWNDGTRCGYGIGDPADAPHCNYVREVDYCSGSALLVRREAMIGRIMFDSTGSAMDWAEVGLAFTLRQHGWKVYYCPRATAVHHAPAGASCDWSSDVRSAIHAAAAFRERWRATLQRRHFPPCRRMFRAREHALGRRVVLVIDHYLPRPDRDAGSRAIIQTMAALQGMNFLVKFWPANGVYDTAERALLEDAGIEVLAGERWAGSFERFIRYAGPELDAVLLSRPDVAQGVIDMLKAHTDARLLFYGHDLHHRRMGLRADVTGDAEQHAAAVAMRELERSLWKRVDAVIYPSDEEADMVAATIGVDKAHAVPLYAFTEDELSAMRKPARGVRLLFVAGFGHSPNIDAAEWLVGEILPQVRRVLPEASLALVGSNPTSAVLALARMRGVEVTGSVSAEALVARYREATLAVVPLRFGAGVKLKVLEAMARGVPVVTTHVGAQGLPDVEACIRVADDAEGLVRAILDTVRNPASAEAKAAAARDYVRRHYAGDGMRNALWRTLVDA